MQFMKNYFTKLTFHSVYIYPCERISINPNVRVAMIFPDSLLECSVCHVLVLTGTHGRFMIKVILIGCCENGPYLLILKEQIDHLFSIDIILGLRSIHSLKVAQSLFCMLAVSQTYLENPNCKFDETNSILKLI